MFTTIFTLEGMCQDHSSGEICVGFRPDRGCFYYCYCARDRQEMGGGNGRDLTSAYKHNIARDEA